MEKKKSVGVINFSLYWLLTGIGAIILTLLAWGVLGLSTEKKIELLKKPATQRLGINSIEGLDKYNRSSMKRTLPLGIITIIVSIGLLNLKKWSLAGIILISLWGITWLIWEIVIKRNVIYYNCYSIFDCLKNIITIYFFTRPKVKAQFQ